MFRFTAEELAARVEQLHKENELLRQLIAEKDQLIRDLVHQLFDYAK
jgi:hypothetical protein